MPRPQITHGTTYSYIRPVGLLRHRLLVRPQDSHDLRLHDATLAVDPASGAVTWAHDVFGNSICLLDWPPELRADTLRIVSRLELTHYPSGMAVPMAMLDPVAENFPFSYAAAEIPDVSRLTERHYPDPDGQVDAWSRRFVAGEGPVATLGMLAAMTEAVRAEFTYQSREAEGTQIPAETLRLGSGTCRDFALLMMEAARSLGLAARFVTGYLYDGSMTQRQGGTVGGGASQAWCAIYLPGAGWVEYDPTNGLVAGTNLIGVARGPEQALPMGGGYVGDASDFMGPQVSVDVLPMSEEAMVEAA